mgnify:CR=1 FL=1
MQQLLPCKQGGPGTQRRDTGCSRCFPGSKPSRRLMILHLPIVSVHALAVATAHGAVDVVRPRVLPFYALAAMPAPGWAVTVVFFASSVVHFAADVGTHGSLLLHGILAITHAAIGARAASKVLMTFMSMVHVPRVFLGLLRTHRRLEATACGVAVATALLVPRRALSVAFGASATATAVTVGHFHQRVVAAHVLASAMHP